jgi:hypothetical protein
MLAVRERARERRQQAVVTTSVCIALAEARAITTPNRPDRGHQRQERVRIITIQPRILPMLGSTLEPPSTTECRCTAE